MQGELDGEVPELGIHLLGVNGAGHESGVAAMIAGRTIPLLQDTAEDDVWGAWAVVYRDVVILDRDNAPVGVFNLTENDLSNMADYTALKTTLIDAAAR
jgi:hypothetical protein